MIPIEKIDGNIMTSLLFYVCILSTLLVISTFLRLKVAFLKKAFIPASLLAGLIGMILGPYALKIIPEDMMSSIGTLPGQMITVVFSCMLLGTRKETKKTDLHDIVTGLGWLWSISFMQVAIPCFLCALILIPVFDVNPLFASLFEIGFAGGHGTASGMASVFQDPTLLNWSEGADLGMTTATIGLLVGIFGGMSVINVAVRKKWTKLFKFENATIKKSEVYDVNNRPVGAKMTVSQDVIEPFALHLGVIGISVLIGRFIVYTFGQVTGYKGLPLFPFAMIGGWILNIIIQNTKLADLFDRSIFQRIQSMALEILIVAAMASVKIPIVLKYWVPLLIGSIFVTINIYIWLICISPHIFKDCWFEQGIIRFGAYTGVAAVGYMLLRTIDPEMETEAGTNYALCGPLSSPFIGGGLVTTAYPYLILKFGTLKLGLILFIAAMVILIILRIFFWNKSSNRVQRS